MQKHHLITGLIIKLAFFVSQVQATPLVIASIKPLYNLTAAISEGVFTPVLLVEDNVSEHDFQLKPSQIAQINKADLIFWVGPELETALTKPLQNIRASKANRMIALPGIKLLANRNLHSYEATHEIDHPESAHEHTHEEHHQHEHGLYDPHIWLSTQNATIMINHITNKLIILDPANKKTYENNLEKFITRLKQHTTIWDEQLQSLQTLPIIVMHDAYQYFNKLNIVGTIVVDHDLPSSIKHIRQIKQVLIEQNVKCICSEPQLNAMIVKTLTEDHKIKHVVIDPLGNDCDLGPDGYIQLIDKLANSFSSCKA